MDWKKKLKLRNEKKIQFEKVLCTQPCILKIFIYKPITMFVQTQRAEIRICIVVFYNSDVFYLIFCPWHS